MSPRAMKPGVQRAVEQTWPDDDGSAAGSGGWLAGSAPELVRAMLQPTSAKHAATVEIEAMTLSLAQVGTAGRGCTHQASNSRRRVRLAAGALLWSGATSRVRDVR